MSSVLRHRSAPRSPMFHHRIENRQQLAHAGGQRHFLRFAGLAEAVIERADHRIAAGGGHRCHVQHGPDGGASPPAGAGAAQGATVPVQRGDPHQRGNLLAVQRADLRQVRSEEHTSELQSLAYLVCRLLLEKKKKMSAAVIEYLIHPVNVKTSCLRMYGAAFTETL